MSGLKSVISRQNLREEAGTIYFKRGLDYFKSGHVKSLEVHDNRIKGKVSGCQLYRCSIESVADWLHGECSCPLGDQGEFCKHLVALGLAFINGFETPVIEKKTPKFNFSAFLKKRNREELTAMLVGAAELHPDLLEYFRMLHLPGEAKDLHIELKQKVNRLLELISECDYEDCYDYYDQQEVEDDTEQIHRELKQLTDHMDQMLCGKQAVLVMELAEYAIKEAIKQDLQSEDACAELISNMLSFYFKAVNKGVGKGVGKASEIAENMIEWEALDSWGALSEVGRYFMDCPSHIEEAWMAAALLHWKKMPRLCMNGAQESEKRAIIEKRLLKQAKFDFNHELELDILRKNQSSEDHVLALTKLLIRRNCREEVLPLLQKAFKYFPHSIDIRSSLVEELIRHQRKAEALKIAWQYFEANPNCEVGYQFLRSVARSCRQAKKYMEKALAHLDRTLTGKHNGIDCRSIKIDILLCEKEDDRALEISENGLCLHNTLYRLAAALAKTRPEVSAKLVKRPLDKILPETGEKFYEKTIKILKLYHKYLTAAEKPEQFKKECLAIREQYKRRRKFIAMLNKARL